MKAMVLIGPSQMELRDVPKPALAPNGLILKMEAAAICNATDYRSYSAEDPTKRWPNQPWPAVIGHEICGSVTEVGEAVEGFHVGERLVGWGVCHGAFAEHCQVFPEETAMSSFRVFSSLSRSLATRAILASRAASSWARALPIPLEPPVIITALS